MENLTNYRINLKNNIKFGVNVGIIYSISLLNKMEALETHILGDLYEISNDNLDSKKSLYADGNYTFRLGGFLSSFLINNKTI